MSDINKQIQKKTAIGITAVIILILLLNYENLVPEYRLLQKELSPYIVPPIEYKRDTYTVKEGHVYNENILTSSPDIILEVLRIARYSVQNRLSPIFSIEGTDPDLLAESIELLEESLNRYVSVYIKKNRERDAEIINQTLYPMDFLSKIPSLEKLRISVNTSPSKTIIDSYSEALEETTDAYLSYIKDLEAAFGQFNEWENRTLGYWGGIDTTASTLDAFKKIKKTIQEKSRENDDRYSCFSGNRKSCSSLAENNIFSTADKNLSVDNVYSQSIPSEIKTNYAILISSGNERNDNNIPIFSLKKSGCLSPEILPIYFLLKKFDIPKYSSDAAEIILLNELFFYDLGNIPREVLDAKRFLGEAEELGFNLLYYNPSREYKCPDAGADITKINTLNVVRIKLIENPVFLNLPSSTLRKENWQNLAELEKIITTTEVLHEETVVDFVKNLVAIIVKNNEISLAQKLSEKKVLFLEKLIRILEQQSGGIDEVFLGGIRANLRNASVEEKHGPSQSGILMRVRGYPHLFLFMFNKSFIEQPISFFSRREAAALESFYTVTYPGALEKELTQAEIINTIYKARTEYKNNLWGDVFQNI